MCMIISTHKIGKFAHNFKVPRVKCFCVYLDRIKDTTVRSKAQGQLGCENFLEAQYREGTDSFKI